MQCPIRDSAASAPEGGSGATSYSMLVGTRRPTSIGALIKSPAPRVRLNPADRLLGSDPIGTHHLIVLVLDDMTVPHELAARPERDPDRVTSPG